MRPRCHSYSLCCASTLSSPSAVRESTVLYCSIRAHVVFPLTFPKLALQCVLQRRRTTLHRQPPLRLQLPVQRHRLRDALLEWDANEACAGRNCGIVLQSGDALVNCVNYCNQQTSISPYAHAHKSRAQTVRRHISGLDTHTRLKQNHSLDDVSTKLPRALTRHLHAQQRVVDAALPRALTRHLRVAQQRVVDAALHYRVHSPPCATARRRCGSTLPRALTSLRNSASSMRPYTTARTHLLAQQRVVHAALPRALTRHLLAQQRVVDAARDGQRRAARRDQLRRAGHALRSGSERRRGN